MAGRRRLRLRSMDTVEGVADDGHCTLVTQCSLDRLDRLVAQATHWPGTLAAAVLAFDGASGEPIRIGAARRRVRAAVERIAATTRVGPVRVALFDEERLGSADAAGLLRLYPINALRNAALDQATGTELVLSLDVDFLPSAGLHAFIDGGHAALRRLCLEERRLLVLPAFESCGAECDAAGLAVGGKRALVAAVASGAARVFASDGRCGSDFPQGHRATDTARWLRSDGGYAAVHEEGYEPFVIAARRLAPLYDERFRGFGRNKILQLWEAARVGGFGFEVLPDHFVVHARHGPSFAQEAVLGARDPAQGRGEGGARVEGASGASGASDAAALDVEEDHVSAADLTAPPSHWVGVRQGAESKPGHPSAARVPPDATTLPSGRTLNEEVPPLPLDSLYGQGTASLSAPRPEDRLLPVVKALYDRARLERLRSVAGLEGREGGDAGHTSGAAGRAGRLRGCAGQAHRGRVETMGRWAQGRAPAVDANAAELHAAYDLHFEYASPRLQRVPASGGLWRRSRLPRRPGDVTLVTCATLDRISRLEAQSAAWGGALSAAVLLPARGIGRAKRRLSALHARVEAEGRCRLDLTLLRNLEPPCQPPLVPINSLRNAALAAAATPLVLLLDVDLIPSAGLNEALGEPGFVDGCCRRGEIWVLPALELAPAWQAPAGAGGDLEECGVPGHPGESSADPYPAEEAACAALSKLSPVEAGRLLAAGRLRGFHTEHYPQGHGPTDFSRWAADREAEEAGGVALPYVVEHAEGFEPFVVASRARLPVFDERFRGYGFDKVLFFHQLHAEHAPTAMRVLPFGFAIDVPHPHSADWHATFDPPADGSQSLQLIRVRALYHKARREGLLRLQWAEVLQASDEAAAVAVLRRADAAPAPVGSGGDAGGLPASAAEAVRGLARVWVANLCGGKVEPHAQARLASFLASSARQPPSGERHSPTGKPSVRKSWWRAGAWRGASFSSGGRAPPAPGAAVPSALVAVSAVRAVPVGAAEPRPAAVAASAPVALAGAQPLAVVAVTQASAVALPWAPGRDWILLTRQGVHNCVVVAEDGTGGEELQDRGVGVQPDTNGLDACGCAPQPCVDDRGLNPDTEAPLQELPQVGHPASPALVAPARYLRVVIPEGSWSPSATAEVGLDVGGVAIRAWPAARGGRTGPAAIRYALRFPSGFAWGRGGTLPGVFTRSGLRVSCGWRPNGVGHVSCTDTGPTRLARCHFVPGRWHFVALLLQSSRLVVYVDDSPIALVELPPDGSALSDTGAATCGANRSAHSDSGVPRDPAADAAPVADGPPKLGVLLTLFYGGKTEEWAAPRDTHVDVGGFEYFDAECIDA